MKILKTGLVIIGLMIFGAVNLSAQWSSDTAVNNAICTNSSDQSTVEVITDGAGGAIIMWLDARNGHWDVYAQRINSGGVVQWTADGVKINSGTLEVSYAAIVTDNAGGAIISWVENYSYLKARRINGSGALQWTAEVQISSNTTLSKLNLHSAAVSDGAVVVWEAGSHGSYDIYAAKVAASDGSLPWTSDVTVCGNSYSQTFPQIVYALSGNTIISWIDMRNGNYDLFAQKLNSAGAAQWTADGIVVCDNAADQTNPVMIGDGSGGAIMAWTDARTANTLDIYAQKITGAGTASWTANGTGVVTLSGGKKKAYNEWLDQLLTKNKSNGGNVVLVNDQIKPRIVSDGSGGAIVVWQDDRNGNQDLFAQRVASNGTFSWTNNGTAVCTESTDQLGASVSSDGNGGAMVVWYNDDNGAFDIYSQRINGSGVLAGASAGVAVSTASGNQHSPVIVAAGLSTAITVWKDYRNGATADLYGAKVNIPDPPTNYTITATSHGNGTISPVGSVTVSAGGTQTFVITPNAGYKINIVTVDGSNVGAVSQYSFTTVVADHSIDAYFEAATSFTISASAGANGAISPSGNITVNDGDHKQFSITPDVGYKISSVLVDNFEIGEQTSYAFTNVKSDHTIAASFMQIPAFTITAIAGAGGSISPAGSVTVNSGTDKQFTISANSGFSITDVEIDGNSIGPVVDYTFRDVAMNHTITATFNANVSQSSSPSVTIGSSTAMNHKGDVVTIPVTLNTAGSFSFNYLMMGKIHYDKTKLAYVSAECGTGSLPKAAGWYPTFYSVGAGEVGFSISGAGAINSDGNLFNISFRVISGSSGTASVTGEKDEWYFETTYGALDVNDGLVNISETTGNSNVKGDANLDFLVTLDDALKILYHSSEVTLLTGQALANADVNSDSKVDMDDYLSTINYIYFGQWSLNTNQNNGGAAVDLSDSKIEGQSIECGMDVLRADGMRHTQVVFEYDPDKIDFNSFDLSFTADGYVAKAFEVEPGKAEVNFTSPQPQSGNIHLGKLLLLNNAGTMNNERIDVKYRFNGEGEFKNSTIYVDGNDITTGISKDENSNPDAFTLLQNYPNPFNPETTIRFKIPKAQSSAALRLTVYDALGVEVAELLNGTKSAGEYEVHFNAENFPSGIYFYRLTVGKFSQVKKMMLLR